MNATTEAKLPAQPVASTTKRWHSVSRAVALVASAALLSPWLAGTQWPQLVPAASAWMAVCTTVCLRRVESVFLLGGLAAAAMALFWRRWFCRWGCPVGLCAGAAGRIGRKLGCRNRSMFPLGQWIAVITLVGAVVGYPLLLFVDPLAILAAFFGLFARPVPPGAIYAALALPAVWLICAVFPGLWCARICPLGATYDILWRIGGWLKLFLAGATGCARAGLRAIRAGIQSPITAEPAEVAEGVSRYWADRPAAGRSFTDAKPIAAGGWSLARRTAIAALLGAVWASLARRAAGRAARKIRPPSARTEADFLGLCVRCGNCVRACPTKIIAPDVSPPGLAGLLAPAVSYSTDYCHEHCRRCTEVCPTGALAPLPGGDKLAAPMGVARVDMNLCLLGDDRECFICRNCCPFHAITLVFDEETYLLTPRINPQRCPGCGACQAACPVAPQKAIVIYPLD